MFFKTRNTKHSIQEKFTDTVQTLEDMDLIFGDTAAYEEKQRIVHIEAQLRGTPLVGDDVLKDDIVQQEHAHPMT